MGLYLQEWDKKCLHVNGYIVQTHVFNIGVHQKFVYNKHESTIKMDINVFHYLLNSYLKTFSSLPIF